MIVCGVRVFGGLWVLVWLVVMEWSLVVVMVLSRGSYSVIGGLWVLVMFVGVELGSGVVW